LSLPLIPFARRVFSFACDDAVKARIVRTGYAAFGGFERRQLLGNGGRVQLVMLISLRFA
jgi:hypothetical protein